VIPESPQAIRLGDIQRLANGAGDVTTMFCREARGETSRRIQPDEAEQLLIAGGVAALGEEHLYHLVEKCGELATLIVHRLDLSEDQAGIEGNEVEEPEDCTRPTHERFLPVVQSQDARELVVDSARDMEGTDVLCDARRDSHDCPSHVLATDAQLQDRTAQGVELFPVSEVDCRVCRAVDMESPLLVSVDEERVEGREYPPLPRFPLACNERRLVRINTLAAGAAVVRSSARRSVGALASREKR